MTISLVCITSLDRYKKLNRLLSTTADYVDEIIVVDGGSDDETKQVCELYGAKMFYRKWDNNYFLAKKYALTKATEDWILLLDDDEFLEYSLWSYLKERIDWKDKKGYAFVRKNYFRFNSFLPEKDLPAYPDWQIKLFPKGVSLTEETIHASPDLNKSGYPLVLVPEEFGGIIHEKSSEDQKYSNELYRKIEIEEASNKYLGTIVQKNNRKNV